MLATVVQSKGYEIEFYRTPPEVPIDHDDFKLIHFKSWCSKTADKTDWVGKGKWGGYPNSVGLISDTERNVYFVGMHTNDENEFIRIKAGWGSDWIDLFSVDTGRDTPPAEMLTKQAYVKVGSSEESVGERAGFLGRILGRLKIA